MSDMIIKSAANGVRFGYFPQFQDLAVKHGISTRVGGVSGFPFATLNLGLHTGDDREKVIINRQRFCDAVGVPFDRVVTGQQVHGSEVAIIQRAEAGKGAKNYAEAIAGVDALITNEKNLPLMLFFADCVPVLIADPVHMAIGISHAGWKGTVGEIGRKTLLAMQAAYGTVPGDCFAAIGPSIGPCCYEVDEIVINQLKDVFPDWQQLIEPASQNKWYLDLWKTNYIQMADSGVPATNIVTSGVCTSCHTNLFFSHRAEHGKTGRIGAVICL